MRRHVDSGLGQQVVGLERLGAQLIALRPEHRRHHGAGFLARRQAHALAIAGQLAVVEPLERFERAIGVAEREPAHAIGPGLGVLAPLFRVDEGLIGLGLVNLSLPQQFIDHAGRAGLQVVGQGAGLHPLAGGAWLGGAADCGAWQGAARREGARGRGACGGAAGHPAAFCTHGGSQALAVGFLAIFLGPKALGLVQLRAGSGGAQRVAHGACLDQLARAQAGHLTLGQLAGMAGAHEVGDGLALHDLAGQDAGALHAAAGQVRRRGVVAGVVGADGVQRLALGVLGIGQRLDALAVLGGVAGGLLGFGGQRRVGGLVLLNLPAQVVALEAAVDQASEKAEVCPSAHGCAPWFVESSRASTITMGRTPLKTVV